MKTPTRFAVLFFALLVWAALLAQAADPPEALSDADAIVYLKAALKQARAEGAQATAAAKYYEAEKASQAAGTALTQTIRTLKAQNQCGDGCELDDATLRFIRPKPPAPPAAAPAP